jgi:hypothetical protein
VQHFTDVEGAVDLFFMTWFLQLNVSFVAVIVFYVQMFFCYRLWVGAHLNTYLLLNSEWMQAISKKFLLVAFILVLFVFALLSAIVSVRPISSQMAD